VEATMIPTAKGKQSSHSNNQGNQQQDELRKNLLQV
jgi:hypothetical protein